MRFSLSAALLSSAVLSVPFVAAIATPPKHDGGHGLDWVSSKALQKEITSKGLMENLKVLDKIATKNGGNRAFGFPGFDASRDYIVSRTKKSKTWKTTIQDFPGFFALVTNISLIVDDVDYYVIGLTYSPSTTPEGITAPLVLGPSGAAGCSVDGYAGLDVKDKIVLVERGSCPDGTTFAGKMKASKLAGAAATIIYHSIATKLTAATLSLPNPTEFHPTGGINQVDGQALRAKLEAGEELIAYFQQTQLIETRITQNVFAESKGGDPNNVIMLGAHLDSVQAGAGINDDGSGSTLILELFDALQKFKFKNKIRLAWWGAEENGLVGSKYYTSHLSTKEINSLLVYLNFDMVSRGYFGVFDGDGSTHGLVAPKGSETIEKLFVDDLTSKGINVTAAIFTGGSDYASFLDVLKKPVGGLHTGTGVAQDDCYHQACDTYANANSTVLTINAKTTAHVLSILAQKGEKLIPKTISTVARDTILKRDPLTGNMIREAPFYPWPELDGLGHSGLTCGGLS